MRQHPYQLQCPIARSLDVLGDRWTLLILRDLHASPAGFKELEEGLGIATNLLSARLKEMTASGLIERKGTGRTPYALTSLGKNTENILWELSQFAVALDPEPDPRDPGNVRALVLPLRVLAKRAAPGAPIIAARLHFGNEQIDLRSTGDEVLIDYCSEDDATEITIATTYQDFLDLALRTIDIEQFAKLATIEHGHEHLPKLAGLMRHISTPT